MLNRTMKKLFILVNIDVVTENSLGKLQEILETNKGTCQCYFNIVGKNSEQQVYLSRKYSIKPTSEFLEKVQSILGSNSVKVT